MFSKACEYGIRAATCIARHSKDGKRISLREIAEEIGSPEAFTAKILQDLVRNNIVQSVKGVGGGFEISLQQSAAITLSDIVLAIDGDSVYTACLLGLKDCSEAYPCPVHHQYKNIRKDIRKLLEKTNLHDMSESVLEGLTCLKF